MYWIGKCEIKAPDKFRFDRMEFYPSYPSDFDVEYDYENKTITFTDALKNPFDSDSWGPLKLMINVTAGNGGDSVTIYE